MIKKFIKKIGKGIRTGLKSIGKAFKKAFKGLGKFIGKLGPIGMLGMMLIMPQMASWWGSFGKWAGTLGKGFGSVMRGIHKAGTMVGKAYSTVTDTISGTMNKITGGSFARPGGEGMFAGEYVEGASDKLANWMGQQMDKGREFLGLETSSPMPTTTDGTNLDVSTDVSTDVSQDVTTTTATDTPKVSSGYNPKDQQIIDQIQTFENQGLNNIADGLKSNLSPEGLNLYDTYGAAGTPTSPFSDELFTDLGIDPVTGEYSDDSFKIINPKEETSLLTKAKKGYTTLGTIQKVASDFGLTEEETDLISSGGYIADIAIPMYDGAQEDWLSQGYTGTPMYGIGSPEYFNSIFMRA